MSNGSSDMLSIQERVRPLLEAGRLEELAAVLTEVEVHPSDVADLLEALDDTEAQVRLVRALPTELASESLAEMEDGDDRADLLGSLEPSKGAELVHEMADDDAADLIGDLEPEDAARILAALPSEDAAEIRDLLEYDEETAGGLMTTEFVVVAAGMTALDAIEEVRRQGREVEDFYAVFVVDAADVLLGTVPLDDLIVADTEARVADLVHEIPVTVTPDVDQEEVGRLLSRYNLVSLPVVGFRGELLGRITFDDVIDVIEAEQTEDILRLAGVSDEEEVRGDWQESVQSRLPWLLVNLVTVALASSVVFLFGSTLEEVWYLAAIMPVVAGLGGNSGTQALAVTVRRIALSDGPLERRSDAVGKELLVGLVNGIALGAVAAGVAWAAVLWAGLDPQLPWVVLFALWGNIVVSGFAGAFIPTILHRLGIDPAVASSVFLTALTDLCGFMLLLGLASALLV
jgi:magnesium transporter